jgi:hypothetical protein
MGCRDDGWSTPIQGTRMDRSREIALDAVLVLAAGLGDGVCRSVRRLNLDYGRIEVPQPRNEVPRWEGRPSCRPCVCRVTDLKEFRDVAWSTDLRPLQRAATPSVQPRPARLPLPAEAWPTSGPALVGNRRLKWTTACGSVLHVEVEDSVVLYLHALAVVRGTDVDDLVRTALTHGGSPRQSGSGSRSIATSRRQETAPDAERRCEALAQVRGRFGPMRAGQKRAQIRCRRGDWLTPAGLRKRRCSGRWVRSGYARQTRC